MKTQNYVTVFENETGSVTIGATNPGTSKPKHITVNYLDVAHSDIEFLIDELKAIIEAKYNAEEDALVKAEEVDLFLPVEEAKADLATAQKKLDAVLESSLPWNRDLSKANLAKIHNQKVPF